ncbi:ATP-binding protein [uncultured Phascolarctobacterium sp.]|uniref:ATP-binding protein n=1 Tax=uncultured Phascolarctobacterium sp. TaxID=512296 RepID=UPI0026054EEC|nr:ATP-binding protein [uncultured Phascolarctobacterium sp.]
MWKKFKQNISIFKLKNFSLSQQIVLLISLVVCIALLPASMFTIYRVSKVIYDRVSINAVSINNILCNSTEIQQSLEKQNIHIDAKIDSYMAAYVNDVDHSDEAGVAIYDKHGRLRVMYNPGSLPNFADSARDLMEKYAELERITWQENYAIPNKAFGFVKGQDNETIGYVVTGYSDDILNKSTIDSVLFLLLTTLLGLVVGIIGAIFLAGRIKKVLFGYEPEEIARLLQERNIILNSVREGIINVNSESIITVVNSEAKMLLEQAGISDCNDLYGKSAMKVLNHVPLNDIIKERKTLVDASVRFGNTVFVVTAVPLLGISTGEQVLGAVITFRKKSVVEEMANQLTGFKNYVTALRAQTHEFMNKMHVIMGLIDMKAYDELKNYTQEIAYNRQSEVSYIVTRLKDITLSGFILGKISRSRELDIDFRLTEESEVHSELEVPSVHDIVLIAGNLIENAFDALKNFNGERIVNLSILDFDKEIVIVVEDSGPGMSEVTKQKIYERGFSTKDDSGRGFGLFLAKQSVDSLNGTIIVESALGEGTTFTVRLPVKKEAEQND